MSPYMDYLVISLQEEYIYLIKRLKVAGDWFLFDLTEETYTAMWTKSTRSAFKFPSEIAVEEFRSEFISPRPVEIVRIKRLMKESPKQSIIMF